MNFINTPIVLATGERGLAICSLKERGHKICIINDTWVYTIDSKPHAFLPPDVSVVLRQLPSNPRDYDPYIQYLRKKAK